MPPLMASVGLVPLVATGSHPSSSAKGVAPAKGSATRGSSSAKAVWAVRASARAAGATARKPVNAKTKESSSPKVRTAGLDRGSGFSSAFMELTCFRRRLHGRSGKRPQSTQLASPSPEADQLQRNNGKDTPPRANLSRVGTRIFADVSASPVWWRFCFLLGRRRGLRRFRRSYRRGRCGGLPGCTG